MSLMRSVNKACTYAEMGFNVAESMPVVPVFSGAIRFQLGFIQIIAGSVTSLVGLIGQGIESCKSSSNPETMKSMRKITRYGSEHTIHGALNALRGLAAAFLGYTTLGIANLFTFLPFNLTRTPKFSPVYAYDYPAERPVPRPAPRPALA